MTSAISHPTTPLTAEDLITRFVKLSEDLQKLTNISTIAFQQTNLLDMFQLPDLSGLGNASLVNMLTGMVADIEQGQIERLNMSIYIFF